MANKTESVWTEEDQRDFEQGLNEFFELLFSKIEAGETTHNEAKQFFHKEARTLNKS